MEGQAATEMRIVDREFLSLFAPHVTPRGIDACCRVSKSWLLVFQDHPYFVNRCAQAGITPRMVGTKSWRTALFYYSMGIHLKPKSVMAPVPGVLDLLFIHHAKSTDYQLAYRTADKKLLCHSFTADGPVPVWELSAPRQTIDVAFCQQDTIVLCLAASGKGALQAAGWDSNRPGTPTWGPTTLLFPRRPSELVEDSLYTVGSTFTLSALYEKTQEEEYVFGDIESNVLGRVRGTSVNRRAIVKREGEERLVFEVTRGQECCLAWYTRGGELKRETPLVRGSLAYTALAGPDDEVLFAVLTDGTVEGVSHLAFVAADSISGETLQTLRLKVKGEFFFTFEGFALGGEPAAIVTFTRQNKHLVLHMIDGELRMDSFETDEPLLALTSHLNELGLFLAEFKERYELVRFTRDAEGKVAIMRSSPLSGYGTGTVGAFPVVHSEGEAVVTIGAHEQWLRVDVEEAEGGS